jgi:trehalose 6-phosphate phosphatase
MSIELHPPVPTDKGMVLRHLVASLGGVEAVIFVGDDVGDLPAFEALSDLRDAGLTTVAVAVASTEMDPRMRDRADLVIADTDVELLLRALHHGAGVDG